MLSVKLCGSASTFKFEIFDEFLTDFGCFSYYDADFAERNFAYVILPLTRRCLKAGMVAGRKPGGM